MFGIESNEFASVNSIALNDNVLLDKILVKQGENLKEGTIIILSTGKAVKDTGIDINLAYGILANDVDATAKDTEAYCYVGGALSKSRIIYPSGKSYTDYKEALRNKGIVLR